MNLRYYKLTPFIFVVITIATMSSWLATIGIPNQLLKYLSPNLMVSAFLLGFNKWFWKLPICSFLMTVPNISGHYIGQIEFYYKGKRRTKNCTMEIRQSSMRVDVETKFDGNDEGEPPTSSDSLIASILKDEHKERFKLVFFYENRGSCMAGDTLDRHYGTNVLDIKFSKETIELDGYYFTSRKPEQTMGMMKVSKQKT